MVPADAAPKIVGRYTALTKGGARVAGADGMTIEEVVRKVLLDEHADVIREAVKAVAVEMMETRTVGRGGRFESRQTAQEDPAT